VTSRVIRNMYKCINTSIRGLCRDRASIWTESCTNVSIYIYSVVRTYIYIYILTFYESATKLGTWTLKVLTRTTAFYARFLRKRRRNKNVYFSIFKWNIRCITEGSIRCNVKADPNRSTAQLWYKVPYTRTAAGDSEIPGTVSPRN